MTDKNAYLIEAMRMQHQINQELIEELKQLKKRIEVLERNGPWIDE